MIPEKININENVSSLIIGANENNSVGGMVTVSSDNNSSLRYISSLSGKFIQLDNPFVPFITINSEPEEFLEYLKDGCIFNRIGQTVVNIGNASYYFDGKDTVVEFPHGMAGVSISFDENGVFKDVTSGEKDYYVYTYEDFKKLYLPNTKENGYIK